MNLTFVGTSSGVSLYVDGIFREANSAVISCPMRTIGSDDIGGGYMKGNIDDVKVYNSALSANEICNLAMPPEPASGTAYLNFNEGSGTTAADSWGTNTGTLVGPVWTSGKFGNALSFDGVNDYVNLNKADIPVPWTASMWVNNADNPANTAGLMGSSTCALKIEQFNNTNKVGFTKYGVEDYVFNYTVPTGTWVNLTFMGTSSGVSLYVNGIFKETNSAAISCPMSTIGAEITGGGYMKGKIDDVKIYNRALSSGEIIALGRKPSLSLASQVLINKGLQVHSWITTNTTGRPYPTTSEYNGFNLSGVTYYESPQYNLPFQTNNPTAQWNTALAPYSTGTIGQHPPSQSDFLSPNQLANISNAVSFCFGDEQSYSDEPYLKSWFALSHRLYPNVLVHSNQYTTNEYDLNEWTNAQLSTYLTDAYPDILTFDNYYFYGSANQDYLMLPHIMNSINTIRPLALGGYDGTGNSPIAFGQYLCGYKLDNDYELTESQKYLAINTTLAMGGKWLDLFRWEYDPSVFLLFDSNRQPTHHYTEYAEAFRQARNLGPHLIRLNSKDVRVLAGQHMVGSTPANNALPASVPAFAADTEYHLTAMSATNLGTQNSGLRGDVTIGYLKPLPGLDTSVFFTSTDPKYFMVVNSLTAGLGLIPSQQHGLCSDTQQRITLTFDMAAGGDPLKLRKVDRNTGAVQNVSLTYVSGTTYKLDLTLGGGQAELLFWAE